MDNIKDEKVIKIKLSRISEKEGTFQLMYLDKSSDDFMSIKTTFTYTGRYREVSGEESKDMLFGVVIPMVPSDVNKKHSVAQTVDDSKEESKDFAPPPDDRQAAEFDVAGTIHKIDHNSNNKRKSTAASKRSSTTTASPPAANPPKPANCRTTRFTTERLVCKLSEGDATATWVIEPSEVSDCQEMKEKDPKKQMESHVSWLWPGSGARETHKAPIGSLDFIGEENFDTGAINLVIRIPQLAAGWNPPVVVLNELGGWQLGKKVSVF